MAAARRRRPILVGLNNPISPKPDDALVPWPANSTGDRLLRLIQLVAPHFDEGDYLEAFERANLWRGLELPTGPGSTALLQRDGRRLLAACTESPRDVVLLGSKVWYCVLTREPTQCAWFASQERDGSTFWHVPHPSGASREYNDEQKRLQAGALLYRLATEGRRP